MIKKIQSATKDFLTDTNVSLPSPLIPQVVFTNPVSTNANYNRNAAYNYISKYVLNYNRAYRDFTNFGGDCTNFVSQVLKAGGMDFTPIISNPDYNYGYYHNPIYGIGRTATWTGANEFRQHWADINGIGKKRAYRFTKYTVDDALDKFSIITNDVFPGDIIQHVRSNNNDTYHSQAIHSFIDDDIIIAQHTSDGYRRLKTYLQEKQYDGYGSDFVCVIQIKNGS